MMLQRPNPTASISQLLATLARAGLRGGLREAAEQARLPSQGVGVLVC